MEELGLVWLIAGVAMAVLLIIIIVTYLWYRRRTAVAPLPLYNISSNQLFDQMFFNNRWLSNQNRELLLNHEVSVGDLFSIDDDEHMYGHPVNCVRQIGDDELSQVSSTQPSPTLPSDDHHTTSENNSFGQCYIEDGIERGPASRGIQNSSEDTLQQSVL